MSETEDDTIFITQSKYLDISSSSIDTDFVLSDVLDLEKENNEKYCAPKLPNFDLKVPSFSDISDDELLKATQILENTEPSRFQAPMQQSDLDNLVKNGLSKRTQNKSKWAVNLFEIWRQQRQNKLSNEKMSMEKLLKMTNESLNEALSYFVAEVRNVSGQEYKPNTLYEIVIAIQHYFRESGRFVSFLDDVAFDGMRRVLDAKMKDLSKQGLGIQRKKAEIISVEQEEQMWQKHILGDDTPQKLLSTVLYQLGLHFALRAGQEHRSLRVGPNEQITVKCDLENRRYLEYHEDVSKSNQGGLLHRKVEAKVTRAYENKKNPERCPVTLYEKYISLRPVNGKSDAIYLRPLKNPTPTCWYSDSPVGVHLLQQTVGKLCESAGFKGHYTNHSLRATAATRLYSAGVDEQLIAEKTGHRSNAVRSYKRTTDGQLLHISDILHSDPEPGPSEPKRQILSSNADAGKCRELNIQSGSMSLQFKF